MTDPSQNSTWISWLSAIAKDAKGSVASFVMALSVLVGIIGMIVLNAQDKEISLRLFTVLLFIVIGFTAGSFRKR